MSNIQKKNVPELRFPEFEGEWEEKKLGEVGTFTSGGTPLKSKSEYWNGDIPWITTGDIHNIKRENITNFITEKGLNESSAKLITNEAILIAMYGQGKTRGMSAILNFEATTNQACAIYQTNQNINFVFQYFQKLYEFLRSLSNEGSQKNLSLSLLKEITLNYPNEQEQKKIGDFFSKLDRQIELEEQKLELLQQQKKGYMQKIFSRELRFKDENGNDYPDWEKKKLGDITEQSMYGIGASATEFDSKNIYIRITDIDEKSRKLNYQNLTTPDELNNKYKLKRNDILFARTGASTGKSYIHKEEKDIYNYYFAGFLIKFEIDEQNNPLFIYQFTLTSKFNKWVKVMSVRSGQPGINSEEYAKLPLVLPNKLEQQKIAEFLDRFDRQIELEKQKIEILQQQKKGLLQSMFI
ncbi:TPA: restriction endonuclease subunit S [Staphylococcus aureus]|uniref:restriction endonuclease subunit S n=1 Tax=Staphylococcus aureus TaxID=1280 RepID=UPI001C1E9D38|nr:restriction endonuclease subunit S [Staphylococcus aureus]MBU6883181.1 restriction endonuclease subunit S [Staphylococcus aureus]MBU6896427.1 restriction endonuclease subunit S [Staphylococcus aureus]HCX2121544.1 restriction endonuclease subunit S [Staphylococcus aureus]HCX3691678.1 restriction endonuclease subunit S [Staphylococcus aureus]HDH4188096.1 restriction endonuclease subunit S [Staphylococcus aureus]